MQAKPKRTYQRTGIRTKALSISLPVELLAWVEARAEQQYTSLSAVVVEALRAKRDAEAREGEKVA